MSERIAKRFLNEAFGTPLLDNSLRGYWCEYMVAEALGEAWTCVGLGWHPWDIQFGPDAGLFPNRIRVQVKNSAALQPWNARTGKVSDCKFDLSWRQCPSYFRRDCPNTPIEAEGFMCDLFVLCHHPITDLRHCNHRDPNQWDFYLLPSSPKLGAITQNEVDNASKKLQETGRPSKTVRTPTKMRTAIRGRKPIVPLKFEDLSTDAIAQALELPSLHRA